MFQENIDVRPHLLILNKVDLTDLSDKQVRSRRNMLLFYQIIIILKSLTQNDVFTFILQKILKMLQRNGVKNVLFTDCLKQRDDNIKKVKVIFSG